MAYAMYDDNIDIATYKREKEKVRLRCNITF